MPKKGLGLDGGREKGGLIRVTGHFRNLLSSSPPPSSYRMPGRIIDKIALREDFDPWLPNIEKISTMRWVKEFLENSLGERKKLGHRDINRSLTFDILIELKSSINMPGLEGRGRLQGTSYTRSIFLSCSSTHSAEASDSSVACMYFGTTRHFFKASKEEE